LTEEKFPVFYHIHGWKGNESSDILNLQKVYSNRNAITVFINAISSKDDYLGALFEIGRILIEEMIPFIDSNYRTKIKQEFRGISGFSMGANMAFYYAIIHPEVFSSVAAYAATFHHLLGEDCNTVGTDPMKVKEIYCGMIRDKKDYEVNNILQIVRENANSIRESLAIDLSIGSSDILFCENEIMNMHLASLNIPHGYYVYSNAEHTLKDII
jgi:S-formylglutathione hydrolase FrmB